MTHHAGPSDWAALCLVLLAAVCLVWIGWTAHDVWGEDLQANNRAAVDPHETPTTLHTLRGARTACTALVERLDGLHEVSQYAAPGGGP